MKVSEIVGAQAYPHINHFVESALDMQLADVRALLQLPRPSIGITSPCNFPIVATLCNLVSGISVTIHKPAQLLGEVGSECPSGEAFKDLVRDFFPCRRLGAPDDIPDYLYEYYRNPLAHSAAIADTDAPRMFYCRVLPGDEGWSDSELEQIERDLDRSRLPHHSIEMSNRELTIHADCFYFDAIRMLRDLIANPAQAQAAERRFSQGAYVWRLLPGRRRVGRRGA